VSETEGGDGRHLSLLVQLDAQSPARRVLVLDATHSHARTRLHPALTTTAQHQ